jgi:hypothetical protein
MDKKWKGFSLENAIVKWKTRLLVVEIGWNLPAVLLLNDADCAECRLHSIVPLKRLGWNIARLYWGIGLAAGRKRSLKKKKPKSLRG